MKINKRILWAGLFVSGIASAQEFYTCVPKKSWWKNTIKESVKEQKKEEWKLMSSIEVPEVTSSGAHVFSGFQIGTNKIILKRGNEIIGQKIIEASEYDSIYGSRIDVSCSNVNELSFEEYDFKEAVFLNGNYFILKGMYKFHCKDFFKIVFLTSYSHKVLFAAMSGDTDDPNRLFKDTILEAWKKVEY